MKIKIDLLLIIISSVFLNAQEWETPVIDGYGEVKYFEKAAIQPNPSLEYKLLFDIENETEKNGVNKGLWVIARTLNMLSLGKVPSNNIKIVASIHGDASFIALNDKAYQNKFAKSNPNLDLINKLRVEGVELFVCSQATAARNIDHESINTKIIPALSGLSVLATYQQKAFILMPF
mgnify:CR=1 FL=1